MSVPSLGKRPPMLRITKNDPRHTATITPILGVANLPIMSSLDVNLSSGIKAKGSWMLYTIFRIVST